MLPLALSETALHHLGAVKGVRRYRNGDKTGRFGDSGPLNLLRCSLVCLVFRTRDFMAALR